MVRIATIAEIAAKNKIVLMPFSFNLFFVNGNRRRTCSLLRMKVIIHPMYLFSLSSFNVMYGTYRLKGDKGIEEETEKEGEFSISSPYIDLCCAKIHPVCDIAFVDCFQLRQG